MSVEDRLRDLWRRSGDADGGGGWDDVQRRIAAAESSRRRRRLGASAGAVSLAAAIAVIAFIGAGGDDDPTQLDVVTPATDPTTSTSTSTSTTTTTSTAAVPEEPDTYVWYGVAASPSEAALAFLREVAGMERAVVAAERPGEVDVVPRGDLDAFVTTVSVDEVADGWGVSGSTTANIELEQPQVGVEIGQPLRLSGRARAFEGNVEVLVVQDDGRVLGESFVTGSGDGTLGFFDGEMRFDEPTEDRGAIVLRTSSAEDGAVLEAHVQRVGFARCGPFDDEPPGEGGRVVLVHFVCREGMVAVPRRVGEGSAVLRAAMEELLEGPTQEERDGGLQTLLGPGSEGALLDVTISDGTAVVDLDSSLVEVNPGVGTSTASVLLLYQLDFTVFQFPTVERVAYQLDGDCEAFFGWLQMECEVRERR